LYKQYAVVIIGARASQLILSLILYYWLRTWGIIIGFIVSFLLFSHRYFISIRKFTYNFDEIKDKMKFATHAYSFNMSTALLMYFDKFIIPPLFGYAILGYYQIGLQFLLFIGMIPISLYQYLLSEESSGLKKTRIRLVGLIVSISLAALLFTTSPYILQRFFPHFLNSLEAVRIMSIGIIPMTMVWVLNSRFFSTGSTKYVFVGSVIYLATQLVLI